ncbi:MAG: C10 family peptidase, partial [Planctomycetes bacterium]|nr:C10 family peptidase [Planctomycetota bacterium]
MSVKLHQVIAVAVLALFQGLRTAQAAPVAPKQARIAAASFARAHSMRAKSSRPMLAQVPPDVSGEPAPIADPQTGEVLAYVIDLEPGGFVVTSADTQIRPVITHSLMGRFPTTDNANNVLLHLLRKDLKLRMAARHLRDKEAAASNEAQWTTYTQDGSTSIAAFVQQYPPDSNGLLTTTWSQGGIYNDRCPIDPITQQQSYTGCVSAAMAQVVNYWQYPASVTFSDSDNYPSSIDPEDGKGTRTIDITASDADFSDLDYSDLSDDDIARLMFACGVSLKTNYSSALSTAHPPHIALALMKTFGYHGASPRSLGGAIYTKLQANIKSGLPCIFAIENSAGKVGHSVVCDGYRDDGTYHLNFGWGGSFPNAIAEAWYALPTGMPSGYDIVGYAVVDIIAPSPGPDLIPDYYTEGTIISREVDVAYFSAVIGAADAGTLVLEDIGLTDADKNVVDRVISAWLEIDVEETDTGTEGIVLDALGGVVGHIPATGPDKRLAFSVALSPAVISAYDTRFPLRIETTSQDPSDTFTIRDVMLNIAYVEEGTEGADVEGGWNIPDPADPESRGWVWRYPPDNPEYVTDEITEQAVTTDMPIGEIKAARFFVTAIGIQPGREVALEINGAQVMNVPPAGTDDNAAGTVVFSPPAAALSLFNTDGHNHLTLRGAAFQLCAWGMTFDYVNEAAQPPGGMNVSLSFDPSPAQPLAPTTVNGTAFYDNGKPVSHVSATVTIGADTCQTDVLDGGFSITAVAPESSTIVYAGVSDGTLNATASAVLVVDGRPLADIYVAGLNKNDPLEDGSIAHPFDTIEEGIAAATSGARVLALSGKAYMLSFDLTIPTGVTLVLAGDVVVKFEYRLNAYFKTCLDVWGTLELQSAAARKVVFTSSLDDTYGGDSNADGAATSPARGDWGCIRYYNPNNVLHDVVIRYGGHKSQFDGPACNCMVWVTNSVAGSFEARDCLMEHAYDEAINVESAVDPLIHHNVIQNAIHGVAGASATITNNTFAALTGKAVGLLGGGIVDGNIITDCGDGIYLTGASSLAVLNNTIRNCTADGIHLENIAVATQAAGNIVSGCSTGIAVENCSPQLTDNTLFENSIGIRIMGDAAPTLVSNDFLGNTDYGVENNNMS